MFRAPVTAVEEIVASVFAEALGVDRVGLDDDFFALGGNSLIATRVAARLGQALDAQVPVRVLFEASSVELLAARVESEVGSGARAALTAMVRPERIPLSLAQQRMWFLNRFEPGSAVNNIPVAIRLSGSLDVAALQAAVSDVVARHEVLRTVYPEVDGVGFQEILVGGSGSAGFVSGCGVGVRCCCCGVGVLVCWFRCGGGGSGSGAVVRGVGVGVRVGDGGSSHQW